MRPFRTVAVLVLSLLTAGAGAQDLPIQVRLDASTFLYDDSQSLVEINVSFGAATLPFQARPDGQVEAAVPVTFRLFPVTAAAPNAAQQGAVYEEDVTFRYVLEDTSQVQEGQVIVEQVRTAVPPGEYELAVTLTLPDSGPLELRSDLAVPNYASDGGPAMSSIKLASDIRRAEEGDDFVQSGLRILPNPDGFYGAGSPSVTYYAEVYRPPAEDDTYTVLTYVAEGERAGPMEGIQRRVTRQVRPVDVVVGSLDVSKVPSGIYFLRMVVLNSASESVIEQGKRIYVINPEVERPESALGQLDYEDALYAPMGEEELELGLAHARVIGTQADRSRIDAVREGTVEEQRAFLASFWRNRDSDGRMGSNAARDEFYQRLGPANDQFQESGGRVGFETARGRVYLIYGPPSEIERRPFSPDTYPHEIWSYNNIPGEGRGVFIFADRFSSGQYDLIHSDVVGEENNPNWQSELVR